MRWKQGIFNVFAYVMVAALLLQFANLYALLVDFLCNASEQIIDILLYCRIIVHTLKDSQVSHLYDYNKQTQTRTMAAWISRNLSSMEPVAAFHV